MTSKQIIKTGDKSHNLDLINKNYSEKELEEKNHLFNSYDWQKISYSQKLSEGFIDKYANKLDWLELSEAQELSEKLIDKHKDKVEWVRISFYQKLSEKFIIKHILKVDLAGICLNDELSLSENFVKKYLLQPNRGWAIKPSYLLKSPHIPQSIKNEIALLTEIIS